MSESFTINNEVWPQNKQGVGTGKMVPDEGRAACHLSGLPARAAGSPHTLKASRPLSGMAGK